MRSGRIDESNDRPDESAVLQIKKASAETNHFGIIAIRTIIMETRGWTDIRRVPQSGLIVETCKSWDVSTEAGLSRCRGGERWHWPQGHDINNTQAIFFDDITKTIILYLTAGEGQLGAFYLNQPVMGARAHACAWWYLFNTDHAAHVLQMREIYPLLSIICHEEIVWHAARPASKVRCPSLQGPRRNVCPH